jgi:hypothetical protein
MLYRLKTSLEQLKTVTELFNLNFKSKKVLKVRKDLTERNKRYL